MDTLDRPPLSWLLEGDVAIQFQAQRDLCGAERPDLQDRIAREGWGARFLSCQNADGSWGRGFYQPKWISTHYTLLDLALLEASPETPAVQGSIRDIVDNHVGSDGGVNPAGTIKEADVCVNGMFLTYACHFRVDPVRIRSVVDFILEQRMPDGGFNCRKNRSGARHSSLHSTLSLAEGILRYEGGGYEYRLAELQEAAADCREFMLRHRLFRSDRTGEVIHKDFLRMSFPPRWKYDVLRALDYFRAARSAPDGRMSDALEWLRAKRRADGAWPLSAKHPGQVHFDMEPTGKPSRWNTLRALRVLQAYPESFE